MEKDRKKRAVPVWLSIHWKRVVTLSAVVMGIALLCLVGGIVAKYVEVGSSDENQVSANNFYFTLDLLAATDQYAGKDENTITERTINLYGATQASVRFDVRNFQDDLRYTGKNITYTVSYSADSGVPAKMTSGGQEVTSGSTYILAGGAKSHQEFTVSASENKVDGGKIVVKVASSVPYVKEMTLTIVLHPQQYDVLYRVEDAPGDPYATLVIMAGKAGGVAAGKINMDWSAVNATANALQVDSTNTFVNLSGVLPGVGVDDSSFLKSAVSAKKLDENGSVAIYFFKKDPSKDYSKPNTEALKNGDVYQVILDAAN